MTMARSKFMRVFPRLRVTIVLIATLSNSQAAVEKTLAKVNAKPAEERHKCLAQLSSLIRSH